MKWWAVWSAATITWGAVAFAASSDPLADQRLAGVRPQLTALVDAAAADGLPLFLLTNKVREGLAKSVPPPRIVTAVATLKGHLANSRQRALRLRFKAPAPVLLRAMADARQAGLPDPAVDALLVTVSKPAPRSPPPPPEVVARAVEVLTDLKLAGYPVAHASRVVGLVARREPAALVRLRPDVERLRRAEGLTAAETLDAVGLGLARGEQLDRAIRSAQAEAASSRGTERRPGAAPAKRGR